MSSEEELDGLEKAVLSAMGWAMAKRFARVLLAAFALAVIEVWILTAAIIGVTRLHGWLQWTALAVLAVVVAGRVAQVVVNVKRRPAVPSQRAGVVAKLVTLPLNAMTVAAFATTWGLVGAIVIASVLTVGELALWLLMRGPMAKEMRSMKELAGGEQPPRTWEI